MKLSITKYIILFLFLPLATTLIGQGNGKIVGTILSDVDEKLIGVNVALENTTKGTTTDLDGKFVIDNLAPGKYTLVFSSVGFEKNKRTVTVDAGETKQVTLNLKPSMTVLSEIAISGGALDPRNRTITVNEITQNEIQTLNVDQPIRLVEQIPGVDLSAYNQGGVADQFSIRGFGGAGHEGQAGAQIDGVSLNEAEGHSDGYADLNILIPLNIQKVKVYKGPSSVLFGRFAEGGTLAFESRKGGNYQNVSLAGGSFNTLNAQFAIGKELEVGKKKRKLTTNLAYQFFQTDGYAANSDNIRGNVTGRVAYNLTNKTDIALTLRGHSSEWDASGYISEERVNDHQLRNTQEINAENDGGAKQFYSERLDINHTFNKNLRLLVFGYAVQQEFTRWAKFGTQVGGQTERYNTRSVYASGASLNGRHMLGKIGVDWIAGGEFYSETTDRQRWESSNRVRGNQILDRKFGVQTVSSYAKGEFDVSPYFRPSIGVRYDQYFGSYTNNDPGQTPFTNDMSNLSNVSPKVGFRSTLIEGFDLRSSVSQGFTLPNSALKYNPGVNVNPVTLWQYEVGLGYTALSWLDVDVAGYILNTSNEIMENPPGSGDLVNVGATTRRGIESEAVIKPLPGLNIRGTFAVTETEVTTNPEETMIGKSVTNVPQTIGTFDISYAMKNGVGARYRLRDVGPYFTNGDNTGTYEGYTVSHVTLFYNFNQFTSNQGRIFVEVRNVFNEIYSETVFGDPGSQIFTPAPTRNVMVGINYNF